MRRDDEIRARFRNGESARVLGREFSISFQRVWQIGTDDGRYPRPTPPRPPRPPRVPKRPSREQRFWSHVVVGPECWDWKGPKLPGAYQYGQIGYSGRKGYAHRLSWEIHNGPIPNGLQVLHHCDNPPCTRPDHLWLGTPADNMHDRDAKGRGRYGKRKQT